MFWYPHDAYCWQEESTYFDQEVLTHFGVMVYGEFGPKTLHNKNQQYLQRLLSIPSLQT